MINIWLVREWRRKKMGFELWFVFCLLLWWEERKEKSAYLSETLVDWILWILEMRSSKKAFKDRSVEMGEAEISYLCIRELSSINRCNINRG